MGIESHEQLEMLMRFHLNVTGPHTDLSDFNLLGRRKTLSVVIKGFHSTTQCYGPQLQVVRGAGVGERLLALLPTWERNVQWFGRYGEPGLSVILPMTFSIPTQPCK